MVSKELISNYIIGMVTGVFGGIIVAAITQEWAVWRIIGLALASSIIGILLLICVDKLK